MVLEPASDATLQLKQRVRYAILQTLPPFYSYIHLLGRAGCTRAIDIREGDTEHSYTSGRTYCKKKKRLEGPKSSQREKEGTKDYNCH